ncbi:MAG: ABC transporter substrate-binding protein [Anaerolineales bacterium]|nr:ABC transporter substrate-binding protein [Anaerolineales bacterium]
MSKPDQAARGSSRRRFLKFAALAGGAAAVSHLSSGSGRSAVAAFLRASAPFNRQPVRLLGPQATAGLGRRLAGGLRLYWDQVAGWGGTGLRLAASDAGTAAPEPLKVRQAVEPDELGVVIGVVGSYAAAQLRDVIGQGGTNLVVVDGGANVVRADEDGPHLFYSTVGYWQSNWAMGAWAVEHLGPRALVAASMYESGYDALYAAELGIEAARGQVAARHINFGPSGPRPVSEVMAEIKRARPDFVYAAYSGPEAVAFVRCYAEAGLSGDIPLVGSGFLTDESLLPEMGSAAIGAHSALSWAPTLDTSHNRAFTAAYTDLTGSVPDVFAAVGYDTARWLTEALAAAGASAGRPEVVREALLATRFAGPRGAWGIDPVTRQAQTPLYLRQVQAGPGGLVNQVLSALPPVDLHDPRLAALRQAPRTGWLYAYPNL